MSEQKIYDIVIVGAGPAGMTAAIYARRSGLSVVLLDRGAPGGQMFTTHEIDNWPGTPKVSGAELSKNMMNHAKDLGAEFAYGDVRQIQVESEIKRIVTTMGEYLGRTVLVGTGTKPRVLGIKGEVEYAGRGVSYCAVCDGAFFKDKNIVVVGGGNSALEEGSYLANIGKKVTLIHRRQEFRAEQALVDAFKAKENTSFILDSVVEEIQADEEGFVNKVQVKNVKTGEVSELSTDAVFMYVGLDPINEPLRDLGVLSETGYARVNSKMETKIPGVFAAGDIVEKPLRQVVTAVSDGAIAAKAIHEYIEHNFSTKS